MGSEVITIRPASRSDREQILQFEERMMGRALAPAVGAALSRDACYVAVDEDEVGAYVAFNESFFCQTFIEFLAVDPAYRRRGIASKLIRQVEVVAKTPKIFTSTNESNEAMHELLPQLGFQESGLIENLDEGDQEHVYYKSRPQNHGRPTAS